MGWKPCSTGSIYRCPSDPRAGSPVHEECPVAEKRTVPVERIRLDTETVTEQQTVSDEVRKERVDIEGDATPDRPVLIAAKN